MSELAGVELVECCGRSATRTAIEAPAMAGAAFLLPGLVNGYSMIEKWLTGIERGSGIEMGG